jgi:hypothetical protein
MSQSTLALLFFPIQLLILYFISRQTIKELFFFFRRFLPEGAVSVLVTVLFLPGTILHELAHFIMAIILMMHVREVSVLPEFEKSYIKLGKVVYEKKDIVRGILIGIAPIFAGLLIFWMLSVWNLFPAPHLWLSILVGYFVFVVSTTMFSSKQDLVDLVYIIPLAIIITGVLYVFDINPARYISKDVFNLFVNFIYHLNYYFLFSFIIHVGIIIVLKGVRRFIK